MSFKNSCQSAVNNKMEIRFLKPQVPKPSSSEVCENMTLVTPGTIITNDPQYMKGHGAYWDDDKNLVACVQGYVERVNKLMSVRPLRTRYSGDIGDVVVGRISEVGQRRWKVDINSRQDAVLLLSSIFLPGGVQRRKSESDELAMRNYFVENDMLVAEVQMFYNNDQSIGLHTRSTKYGKLRNGCLVTVSPSLIVRCKSHFHSLPCGVDVILGINGWIWVSASTGTSDMVSPDEMYKNFNDKISDEQRESVARVANCILALAKNEVQISDTSIIYTYESSKEYQVSKLLQSEVMIEITSGAIKQIAASMEY